MDKKFDDLYHEMLAKRSIIHRHTRELKELEEEYNSYFEDMDKDEELANFLDGLYTEWQKYPESSVFEADLRVKVVVSAELEKQNFGWLCYKLAGEYAEENCHGMLYKIKLAGAEFGDVHRSIDNYFNSGYRDSLEVNFPVNIPEIVDKDVELYDKYHIKMIGFIAKYGKERLMRYFDRKNFHADS